MLWVLIFAGIALLGVVMVVSYAVWLAHKASDLFAEAGVVLERLGQLGELLGQIRLPELAEDGTPAADGVPTGPALAQVSIDRDRSRGSSAS